MKDLMNSKTKCNKINNMKQYRDQIMLLFHYTCEMEIR